MFSDEIENKLEYWDLFSDGKALSAGKSWSKSIGGFVAKHKEDESCWDVRSIDGFEVGWDDNENKPTIEWYYAYSVVSDDKFVEYMDHLREVITHLKLAEHEMQLGFDLEENI